MGQSRKCEGFCWHLSTARHPKFVTLVEHAGYGKVMLKVLPFMGTL
jgi:hypothetical protein